MSTEGAIGFIGLGHRGGPMAFHAVFALQDQQVGMTAFVEKRPPSFTHR